MTADVPDRPTVAIACQGGGSHTAFTAGVLDRLLESRDLPFDVVGLSGTSGGAICAFVTWYALASEGQGDGRERARQLLSQVWDDLSASDALDTFANTVGVGYARAHSRGVPLPTVSPYDAPTSAWGRRALRSALEAAVDPDDLATLVAESDGRLPRLDIGAVDVQRGTFRTFTERTVSHDAVLASAAVPTLFQAAPVTDSDGTTRWYWDGLFSQNPPVGNLFRPAAGRHERADELWIVQINPQREADIPTDLDTIADRRNELGGNLSVNQELGFVKRLNQWAAEGALESSYRPIGVKTINLDESVASPSRPLDYATKLDRSPGFLGTLLGHGRAQADQFLETERGRRRVHTLLDATWSEAGPLVDEYAVPSYEVHLPTRLSLLRAYVHGTDVETSRLGLDDAVAFSRLLREAVPDLRVVADEVLAEPGKVAIRFRATGTRRGELLGFDPTAETVTLSGMRIDHLDGGRLTGTWLLFEQWNLLDQLGVVDTATPISTLCRVIPTPVVTQLSAPVENETLARAEIAGVWNAGDREALAYLLDDDFVLYLDNASDLHGRDAYWERFVDVYRRAFPDLTVTVEDTVSEGDKIVCRLRLRGTHEGPVLGVEPTGTRVDVARMVVHHFEDGRIVETGIVEDTLGLLHQLGAMPAS